MFTVDELLQKVEEYRGNRMSLRDLDRWFEDNIDGDPHADAAAEQLRLAVDAALAAYHFDHIGEASFREELAEAIRPYQRSAQLVFQTADSARVIGDYAASAPPDNCVLLSSNFRSGNNSVWLQHNQGEESRGNRNAIAQRFQLMNPEFFNEQINWYNNVNASRCATSA